MDMAFALTYMMAVALRLLVFILAFDRLQMRPEISTAVSSFERLREGVALQADGISAYEGDIVHEQPLMLALFAPAMSAPIGYTLILFIIFDLLAAGILGRTAVCYLQRLKYDQELLLKKAKDGRLKKSDEEHKVDDDMSLLVTKQHVDTIEWLIIVCYLFNPYAIVCCSALSTSVFYNCVLSIATGALLMDYNSISISFLSIVSVFTLYPCILFAPIFINATNHRVQISMIFIGVWIGLIAFNRYLVASWSFLSATYGFLLSVPDLTPNVGIFWYFFTEVFDHFRLFFLWVFQLNVFVYVIPLTLALRKNPIHLFHVLLILQAIFKPYPSIADTVVYMALLPLWRHLYRYVRHTLLIACTLAVVTVLAPVMWKLWIDDGSANANFYFATTLAYSTAQIFLLTDLLYAQLRHNVHLEHGIKIVDTNGVEAKVMLRD